MRSGEIANHNYLRGERVIYYRPSKGYLGVDHFSYTIALGRMSTSEGNVRVNVRNCRPYVSDLAVGIADYKAPHILCSCMVTDEEIFGSPSACPQAIVDTCSSSSHLFVPMCVACMGVSSHSIETLSAECLTEVNRATTLLSDRLMCDETPGLPMCEAESVSNPVTSEPWIRWGTSSRLSDMQPLGNSNGGNGFMATVSF